MQTNNQQPADTAATNIIQSITSFKDPANVQDNLRELLDFYLVNKEESSLKQRDDIYVSCTLLHDALEKMKPLCNSDQN